MFVRKEPNIRGLFVTGRKPRLTPFARRKFYETNLLSHNLSKTVFHPKQRTMDRQYRNGRITYQINNNFKKQRKLRNQTVKEWTKSLLNGRPSTQLKSDIKIS